MASTSVSIWWRPRRSVEVDVADVADADVVGEQLGDDGSTLTATPASMAGEPDPAGQSGVGAGDRDDHGRRRRSPRPPRQLGGGADAPARRGSAGAACAGRRRAARPGAGAVGSRSIEPMQLAAGLAGTDHQHPGGALAARPSSSRSRSRRQMRAPRRRQHQRWPRWRRPARCAAPIGRTRLTTKTIEAG